MCEFVSWIEVPSRKKGVYFLTDDLVYKAIDLGVDPTDIAGHEAIKRVFGLDQQRIKLIEKECTDFSKPDNFPESIVRAIKKGEMTKFGVAEGLLTQQALAEYERFERPALAEYVRFERPAWAEYERSQQQAWAEYVRSQQQAWAEYKKSQQQALAEYVRFERPAWAEYERSQQQAWAEYVRSQQQAWAEYKKSQQQAFWGLFNDPKNRIIAWR